MDGLTSEEGLSYGDSFLVLGRSPYVALANMEPTSEAGHLRINGCLGRDGQREFELIMGRH